MKYQGLRFFHKYDDGDQEIKPINGLFYNDIKFVTSCNSFKDGLAPSGFGFSIKTPGMYSINMSTRVRGPRSAMFVAGLGDRRIQNIQIRGFAATSEPGLALDLHFNETFGIGKPCTIWFAIFADWYNLYLMNEQLYSYRGIIGRIEHVGDYDPDFDITKLDLDARHKDDQTTTK